MRSLGRKGHLEESLMLSAVIMARRFQPLSGFRLDRSWVIKKSWDFLPFMYLTLGVTAVYNLEPPTGVGQQQKSHKKKPTVSNQRTGKTAALKDATLPNGCCIIYGAEPCWPSQPCKNDNRGGGPPIPHQDAATKTMGAEPCQPFLPYIRWMSAKTQHHSSLSSGCLLI